MDWPLDLIYEVYQRCRFAEQLVLSRYLAHIDTRFIITRIPRTLEQKLTDDILTHFTGLTQLNIKNNSRVSNRVLSKLTNLHTLDISGDITISNSGIKHLTNLRKLNYSENYRISADMVLKLPKLEQVSINDCDLLQFRNFNGEIWCLGNPDNPTRIAYHWAYSIRSLDEWKLINNIGNIFISESDGVCYLRYRGKAWHPCHDLNLSTGERSEVYYDWHEGKLVGGANPEYPLYPTIYSMENIIPKIKLTDLPIRKLNYHEHLICCDGIDYLLDTKNFCIIPVEPLVDRYFIHRRDVGCLKSLPNEIDTQVIDDILSILVGEECKQEYRRLLRHLFVEPETHSHSYHLPTLLTTWCKVLCSVLPKNPGLCKDDEYQGVGKAIELPNGFEVKTKLPGVGYVYNTVCTNGCGNQYLCTFSCECLCGVDVAGFDDWIGKNSHRLSQYSQYDEFNSIYILGRLFNYPNNHNGHMIINLIKWGCLDG